MSYNVGDLVDVVALEEGDYEGRGRIEREIAPGWYIVEFLNAQDDGTQTFEFPVERLVPVHAESKAVKIPINGVERHPASARFHELLEEAGTLHDMKQADYGRDHDPFANVRSSSDWGIPAWVGAMVRLNDKVKRLQALAQKGELVNEAAVDSFMDIAVYALIARVLYESETA